MDSTAGAILIRSVQPIEGVNLMRIFRRTENIMNLTSVQANLPKHLKYQKITMDLILQPIIIFFIWMMTIKKTKILINSKCWKQVGLAHLVH